MEDLPPAQQTQAVDRGGPYTEKCDLKLTREQSLRHEPFQTEVCIDFERMCAAKVFLSTESGHLRQAHPGGAAREVGNPQWEHALLI